MTRATTPISATLALLAGAPAIAQDAPDWRAAEAETLTDHVQLTFPAQFEKAGEAYFSPDMNWIVFQAIPRAGADPARFLTGEELPPREEEHYQMYVAPLERDAEGRIAGLGEIIRLSLPGSSNTCGFFNPARPWQVMFASTIREPEQENAPGYQRGSGRYRWAFPSNMIVTSAVVGEIAEQRGEIPMFSSPYPRPFESPEGYTAECAYSPDGRFIVYAQVEPGTRDADLWIYDTQTERHTHAVRAEGYDGGPFFSPDGKWLCYRSDRVGNNLLQLYIARLAFDDAGGVTGVEREVQLTDNRDVNWAPYWHPSQRFLAYASSAVSHRNYEVFTIDARPDAPDGERTTRRVTHAEGFDGLPVYSPDGRYLMWTSQRGGTWGDEERPSSQVWIARVLDHAPEGD